MGLGARQTPQEVSQGLTICGCWTPGAFNASYVEKDVQGEHENVVWNDS